MFTHLRYFLVSLTVLCLFCKCNSEVNNTFVPTDNWQTIEEGQAIPAGLHVRINLQTGKKEAKLLEDSNKKEEGKSALIPVDNIIEDSLDLEKLKEALKELKDDSGNFNEKSSKFRTYDEIKLDLEDVNLHVKSDVELLKELMDQYVDLTNGTNFDELNKPQMLAILLSLEYLVHQYDNAIEFARLEGFTTVALSTLNSTLSDNEMREKALLIIGSASQSNPKVQLSALQAGCVSFLLKFLISERDLELRSRGLYALSSMVRSFPSAQAKMTQEGGITVLSNLFDDAKYSNEKIRRKIAVLLLDLIVEAEGGRELNRADIYERIGLEQIMRDQGWCQRIANWLCRQVQWKDIQKMEEDDVDHEVIDVAVGLMLPLSKLCLEDFVTNIELHNVVNHVKQYYSDLVLKEMDEGISDSFYSENLKKLRSLAIILARTTEFKDEL